MVSLRHDPQGKRLHHSSDNARCLCLWPSRHNRIPCRSQTHTVLALA
ncbi:Uncharacterised protein [Vibrio cholerae]|nr:Uncharacterised protein [Vibrio cholerae]